MRVTFDGDINDVLNQIIAFLDAFSGTADVSPEVETVAEEPAPKPKRKRRTKAEMEVDKAEEAPAEEPAPSRRRRTETEEAPAEEAAPSRRRTGPPADAVTAVTPPESGDLSDEEITRAASAAAGVILSKGVKEILEQFGVGNDISQLDQDRRREFVDMLNDAIAEVE